MKKKLLALSLVITLAISLFYGCSTDPVETEAPNQVMDDGFTYADTIAWDGQYDVVVVGFGGAGATAAASAADEGAQVLLVEKAPEGHEGGNTRYCGQLFVYGDEDEEATYAYYKAMAAGYDVPEAMLKVYTKNIAHMYDVVSDLFGLDKSEFVNWTGHARFGGMSPEYPEFVGSDKISLNTVHEGVGDAYLWKQYRKLVTDRTEKIDVWFESPATHLIQDPTSKTILGVQIERDGKTLNIRANNGVVLACGGFENNQEMVECYLGLPRAAVTGSLYNTGDGIRMASEVGADLWHMDVFEGGSFILGSAVFAVSEGEQASLPSGPFNTGSVMLLAGDGSRYLREDEIHRHGHIYQNGSWKNPNYPLRSFLFFDQAQADVFDAAKSIPERFLDQIIKADTLEELADATGMDVTILKNTVEKFNSYAASGVDVEFNRSAKSMTAISSSGPYYALEFIPCILNTQGGPRRNENAEVLDVNGDPIPHLYSAGELGGITSYQYQGGGNMAECIIFGQIAGKNAAAVKSDMLKEMEAVESKLIYTPGVESDLDSAAPIVELGENEYLGVSHNGMGGDLYVKVTVDGGKIVAVEIVQHSETETISAPAREKLPSLIGAANSVDVDNIAGASITSRAIKEAVADALSQVK